MFGSFNEWIVILAVGALLVRPHDFPSVMRACARIVLRYRAWRDRVMDEVEATIRDVEVEDFKAETYKTYEEEVEKHLTNIQK